MLTLCAGSDSSDDNALIVGVSVLVVVLLLTIILILILMMFLGWRRHNRKGTLVQNI